MRLARKLAVGLAAVMLSASAAMAADPIFIPPPPAPPPMAPLPVAYDWSGFYAGAHLVRPFGAPFVVFGGQAGFNIQRGNLVFGFEARGGIVPGGFFAGAGGRAGVALGARGNVLVYGHAALIFVPGDLFYIFGGGGEFGVSDRLSIFAEFDVLGEPGPGGGCCAFGAAAGVNFHFGN